MAPQNVPALRERRSAQLLVQTNCFFKQFDLDVWFTQNRGFAQQLPISETFFSMSHILLPRSLSRRVHKVAKLCLGIVALWLSLIGGESALAVTLQAELVVNSGLSNPVFGAAPAGEMGKLYISEQNNMAIKILDLQTKQLTTFLDLPNIAGGQAGLSAFAFHPDYATNGKFYLNIYDPADTRVKIVEYQRSAENPLVADPNSRRDIYSFDNPSSSHNGGWLGFSPIDGYLYIGTGDGGAIGGPLVGLPAQDLISPQGKIVRLSVDVDDYPFNDMQNHGVPGTNPFVVNGVIRDAFAMGLRHPYRASFDRLTGDLYIGDVGGSRYEEVNILPANSGGGQNYAWRTKEGPFDQPRYDDPIPEGVIDPIYYYPHGEGAAVIGGYVYRGSAIPGFQGHYIFTDAVTGAFTSFRYDGTNVVDLTDRTAELANPVASDYSSIVSFGEDADGELYFFDRVRGDVFKIVAGPIEVVAGDFDRDGDVDSDDLIVWQEGYGLDERGDADGDADTDGRDFLIWQRNFTHEMVPTAVAVPEPTSFVVVIACAVTCFWRRQN